MSGTTSGRISLFVILILTVYVTLIVAFLRFFFRKGIFNPREAHIWTPDIKYKNISLDGIHIWHFNNFPGQPTLIYCHGTTGNISYQKHIIRLAHRLRVNLNLFDYYGLMGF